jgi:hypothetical protein
MLERLDVALGAVDGARSELWFFLFDKVDRKAAVARHKRTCDGEPADAFPGMDPEPCIICHPRAWDRWCADPYGMKDSKCNACGGLHREAPAKRVLTEHAYIGHCYSCGGPTIGRQSATIDQCIAARKAGR